LWRRNANGLRGPDADYVMRHDKYAAEAFEALRKRGLTQAEAAAAAHQGRCAC
jgi:hypothetical protein